MKSKTQKISRRVMWGVIAVTVIVALLFYFGGEVPVAHRVIYDRVQSSFTNLFIFWTIIVLVSSSVLLLFAVLHHLVLNYVHYSLGERMRVWSSVCIVLLLMVTCGLSGGSIACMWFYSIIVLTCVCLMSVIGFIFRRYFIKRKGH